MIRAPTRVNGGHTVSWRIRAAHHDLRVWRLLVTFGVLAGVNLAAGVALLFRPERSFDFAPVLDWSRALLNGFTGAQAR